MKISYQWIKDLVPELDKNPAELAELLTLHSFEVDVLGEIYIDSNVTIAKITKIDPHPDADRLQIATITTGSEEIQVVCGAPNIEVGQTVPYSPPGTVVQDSDGNPFKIKTAIIRGIESPGMLNSLRELGLGDSHDGIWILSDDLTPGDPLAIQFGEDTILDADITPNRSDCLSHIGIAREVAALLGLETQEPSTQLPELTSKDPTWQLDISEEHVKRFSLSGLRSLKTKPSPLWIQQRLIAAGGKPINNLIDITNYVMFELGQPTHLFDAENIEGKQVGARFAKSGEKLNTLDEVERDLHEKDIVVTIDGKPAALAGIKGGEKEAITNNTTSAALEVANFSNYIIQQSSVRHNLVTEASLRFSRGIDPNLVEIARNRALRLLVEYAGAQVQSLLDHYPTPIKPYAIQFDPQRVSKIAGTDIPEEESKKILNKLRLDVSLWPKVTVPTNRTDITGTHDLVEEVIRVHGLANIPSSTIDSNFSPIPLPHHTYWREVVRDTLRDLGFSESLNQSFEVPRFAQSVTEEDRGLSLVNPPTKQQKQLRSSLLPGLLQNFETNRAEFHRNPNTAALFEVGHIYTAGEGRVPGVSERVHLAAIFTGPSSRLHEVAEALAAALGVNAPDLQNIVSTELIHELKYRLPLTGFEINLDDLLDGVEKPVPVTRDLSEIQKSNQEPTQFTALPKFPSVYRDISVIVSPDITIEQAIETISRAGGKLAVDVDLFDEYESDEDTQKSLAFHIEYRSDEKTLTDQEVNEAQAKIIQAVQEELGAQIK